MNPLFSKETLEKAIMTEAETKITKSGVCPFCTGSLTEYNESESEEIQWCRIMYCTFCHMLFLLDNGENQNDNN